MSGNKILVIRGGAIGDFILTLPVLAALRAQFPQTRLEVLGYPHIAQLAVAGGLSDAVRAIDARPLAGFFARNGPLDPALQEYFSGFAIVVSYLFDPDGIFQTNVARCTKAQFLVGPHRPDETAGLHATKVFLKPLERLAIFDADAEPKLFLNSPPPLNQLALHPGSGSDRKNWPEKLWAELLHQLAAQTPLNFLLVGGEAEGDRLERLASVAPPARCAIARNLPLPELALRLRASRAFLGHDSGITHLAAAVGLPGLVLWADTTEAVWRPPSARLKILRDERGLQHLPVTTVRAELENLLRQTHAAW